MRFCNFFQFFNQFNFNFLKKEKFCMMKDKIKFYDSKEVFVKKCPVCFKHDHATDQCRLINYQPDRDFIIKKNNFSVFQERSKNLKFVRFKKYNALKNRYLTLSKALKVDFIEDDSASGLSSDENDFLLSEKYHNSNNIKEKRKKMTFFNPVAFKKEDLTDLVENNENLKEKVFYLI